MKLNKPLVLMLLTSITLTVFTGCEKEPNTASPYVDGLSINNYPVVDGSTSTFPLNTIITCELLSLT